MAHVPDWWPALLLAAAAYRTWKLLAEDTVLIRPRAWALKLGNWETGPAPSGYRQKLAEFIACPWCLGFWISLAWWAVWLAQPYGTLVAATPMALSAAVGAAASKLN